MLFGAKHYLHGNTSTIFHILGDFPKYHNTEWKMGNKYIFSLMTLIFKRVAN
jgi:hypothetical protein